MLCHISRDELVAKLVQVMPGLDCERVVAYADRLIAQTDERLEPNVDEWLHDKPLTDIWIGPYCVGMVVDMQKRGGVLYALEALSTYAIDPARGESLIWRINR